MEAPRGFGRPTIGVTEPMAGLDSVGPEGMDQRRREAMALGSAPRGAETK